MRTKYKDYDGKLCAMYYNQHSSAAMRKMDPPNYTIEEFFNWVEEETDYAEIYSNWVKSDYLRALSPSIDRLDDNFSYTFKNIRLVTWEENHSKYRQQLIEGEAVGNHIPVIQLHKDTGEAINYFYSAALAARLLNLHATNISNVCYGKQKSSGGYDWIFTTEDKYQKWLHKEK